MSQLKKIHAAVVLNDAKPLVYSLIEREPAYYNPHASVDDGKRSDEPNRPVARDGVTPGGRAANEIYARDLLYSVL